MAVATVGALLGVLLAFRFGWGGTEALVCRGVVAPPAGTCRLPLTPAPWAVAVAAVSGAVAGLLLHALATTRFFIGGR